MMKVDLSNDFYCITLNINNISKLVVVFPISCLGEEPLLSLSSPPSHGLEKLVTNVLDHHGATITDIANCNIQDPAALPPPHHLVNAVKAVISPNSWGMTTQST